MDSHEPEEPLPEAVRAFTHSQSVKEGLNIAYLNRNQLGINYEQLPKMPFWSPLFGYTIENWFKGGIASDIMRLTALAARPLSPTETQALAESSARSRSIIPWKQPLVAAVALSLTWRGRGRFRFPFYTPGKSFDPSRFKGLNFLGWHSVLYGLHAIRAWHCVRFASYGLVAWPFISSFVNIYANVGHNVRVLQDPRTKSLIKTIEANNAKRAGMKHRDSASPFGGQIPKQSEQQNWQLPPKQSGQQSWQDSGPSASLGDEDAQPVSSPSSWDRLRRDGGVGARATSGGIQDIDAQGTDSYIHSQKDDGRAERERAQREFDAMLERERQSENSDSQDPF
ncbi:hypothetical protein B0H67DRAFT_315003 [Lasiosphaeris hirsuta]|uniref:Uncharacterized protein n=1 Tax=Lasiosphaeris hirsuta TaxID=260670 RepID=A0AA40DNC2_9PEZI|nr:hypothetical protein B0H67DRAFT_315003 [Lasiosphaeris hirsuta]